MTFIFDKIDHNHALAVCTTVPQYNLFAPSPPLSPKTNCIGTSSISLGTTTIPKRNEKKKDYAIFGGEEGETKTRYIMGDG